MGKYEYGIIRDCWETDKHIRDISVKLTGSSIPQGGTLFEVHYNIYNMIQRVLAHIGNADMDSDIVLRASTMITLAENEKEVDEIISEYTSMQKENDYERK